VTRRASEAPPAGSRWERRPSLPSLRDIAASLDGGAIAEAPRSGRVERIAIVAPDPSSIRELLEPERRASACSCSAPDEVPESEEALVVLIAQETLGANIAVALTKIRRQTPSAKFVFLAAGAPEERARALAPWGPVLFDDTDAARLEIAIRHAASLATMAAETRRLRQTGRFSLPGTPPRDGD
jgi:hypothetical protein